MAYKNLLSVTGLTADQTFRHVKDWLTSRNGIVDYSTSGLGWTLHDSSFATDADNVAANDWVVLSSPGENGKQGMFLQITYATVANGLLRCLSGLDFNASTNAWVRQWPSNPATNGMTSGTVFSLSIFGDLDSFTVLINNGTIQYAQYFGLTTDTMYDQTIATTAGAESAGTDVVVGVDVVPATWRVGDGVVIRDAANMELTTISLISGTDVTMTLVGSYASGARIAKDRVVVLGYGAAFHTTFYVPITRGGVLGSNQPVTGNYNTGPVLAADPDNMNSHHIAAYIVLHRGTTTNEIGYYGRLRNVVAVSITGITNGNAYEDDATGDTWRAILVGSLMFLFPEV